jgi:hypothetical protein
VHDPVVIAAHLGASGQLVPALVDAKAVFAVGAQLQRVHAIKRRGLVQGDKRVGIVPVATGLGVPVNDGDVRIGLYQESGSRPGLLCK